MAGLRRPRQLIGAAALLSCACAHVEPYDREPLARLAPTTTEAEGPAERHAAAVHEGASRLGAVGESGCGCN